MIDHAAAIEKARLGGTLAMLIDGALVNAESGRTLAAIDPSTGGELARFPLAGEADVARAVAAARRAFDEGPWREWGPSKRARAMLALADLCRKQEKELATIESLGCGMPISIAKKLSVGALLKNLEYYAGWADKTYGDVPPMPAPGALDYVLREPIGVIAAIVPWNTPLLFVGSKLGPALATGNCAILKPSESASLGALRVAALVEEAGFPPGVVQIVTGDATTGRLLVESAGVDKVSFTGGGAIGRAVMAAAAAAPKPVVLELGGKSANVVFTDADLDRACMGSVFGCFGLSGQACAAATRLLVERPVHDAFVEKIATFAAGLPIGDPLDPTTLLGPLISPAARARVLEHVRVAVSEGAKIALETEVSRDISESGAFLGPRILTGVTPSMRIWREEVFGPVLAVTPFDSEDEAVRLANDSPFGLAAGLWTRDASRAHRAAAKLRAGTVWINAYGTLPHTAPFGGTRGSGFGREGGRDALLELTQAKNVYQDLT